MIDHPAFTVDEWSIRETKLHLDILAQTESIFALSNGHIGFRGNLDEGEPHGLPGTYLNSVYELRPLPYAEAAYGDPESGQTVINVTNGKIIRLLGDDEPFDVRYGGVQSHERELDLRDGVLRRSVRWTSPVGRTVKVSSVRLVSFTQRSIAAISYEVEPLDAPVRVVVQSELVANEELPGSVKDPRAAAVLASALECEEHQVQGTVGLMVHHTRASGLRVGAATDHLIEGPPEMVVESESHPDVVRVSVTTRLTPGERLRIVKLMAYGWSSVRSRPALHDQVVAALSAARLTGWEGLLSEQRAYLDDFWGRADVELEGDSEIQQAVRFALFHVLQASARGERRPIPAKGLTGPGYDGHTFWDTEVFVLPVLTLTLPEAAADALSWRYSILELAKERARQLRLRGAVFPWRTIHGEECSGYWPASTAAFHINADIAYAVVHYMQATGNNAFEEEVQPHPSVAHALGVDAEEIASWRDAADKMLIPYDERLGVTPQAESFTEHEVWDFASTAADQYPLLLHFPYFDLYRKQVLKQADLVLAMQLCGEAFTAEQKARNFAYYEPLTVRDSSLSASTQAVLAAEVGQRDLAYDYLGEAALIDLQDLHHNVRDGLHMASLAGAWTALVAGFGGMRLQNGSLCFAPRLPEALGRLAFHLLFRGCRLRVEVRAREATYRLLDGSPLVVHHHGEEILLPVDEPITRPIPPIQAGPRPTQPPGREPAARGAH